MAEIFNNAFIEVYILWALRIGAVLFLLGFLLPQKNKKTFLSKVLRKRQNPTSYYAFFDQITERAFFKPFLLLEGTKEYRRIDTLINKAGIEQITPNIIQIFRFFAPPLVFVLGVAYYLTSMAVRTVQLTSRPLPGEQIIGLFPVFTPSEEVSRGINPGAIVLIFILSLFFYILPEMYLKSKVSARRLQMKKELPIVQTFIIIMLESGTHTVYDILKTLLDTTTFFRPYILVCLNEYHINPKRAIQNMADYIDDEEFQIVCNGLKQAVETDKQYAAIFMRQHLEQLQKLQSLQRESDIKKKPLVYVFLLAFPLINVVIIWFYPWLIRALDMLGSGF